MPFIHTFDDSCSLQSGSIPSELVPDGTTFEALWNLHPKEHSIIVIHGKRVAVPRWEQAYGKDYAFSNQTAVALKIPEQFTPYLDWARAEIEPRLNGIFVNWHDGAKKHYHGKHRDSTKGIVAGTPIVTISLGEERVFRMRPHPSGSPKQDFMLENGDYVVIPWETNQNWSHEVPKSRSTKACGYR